MLAALLSLLIRVYQRTLSPMLGPVCRFEPSCSKYALLCIEAHGAGRGSWLTLRRLARCHPFHPGGYDPPPPRNPLSDVAQTAEAPEHVHARRVSAHEHHDAS